MTPSRSPSRQLRIAHVTATFPPYMGGTGNVALQNARCLVDLGHRVSVFTASGRGRTPSSEEALDVRRLWTPFRIGNAPLLPGLLVIERHDLVHLHVPFIFGAELVTLLHRLRGQPYVLTHHNDLVSPGAKGVLFRGYNRMISRRVLAQARRIIVTSIDGAAVSPLIGPIIRSEPDRIREVPNGVDMALFRPGVPATEGRRPPLVREGGDRLILFVGSMDSAHHPKGGVPVLLQALRRLRDPHVILLLAGSGDRVDQYRSLAKTLGLEQNVRFLGRIPNQELPPVYAAADVVVVPSVTFEPFGLVAVEAMACGKPVVASDLPGVRRVVADAGGGVLVRPGDADDLADGLRALLGDQDRRAALGAAGRAGVEQRYDVARIGPILVATYEEAIAA